jgi:RNA polymerase sigma factor (sigma-70 family)
MEHRSRAQRLEVLVRPQKIDLFCVEQSAWYETPEEIERGLERGVEKARLLRWVRRQMGRKLTARERHCIELYFFEGLTFREIARRTDTNASSAYRAVRRALRKLKVAAQRKRSTGTK